MLGVAPDKKCLAMTSGIFDVDKALQEVGSVFHDLKLRFRIGLSSDILGRLRVLNTSESIKKLATGSERMEVPRSASSVRDPAITS